MDTKLCDKCKESKNFLYTFGLQKSNQLITCKIIMKLNSVKCFGTLSICPHPYKSILVRGGPFAKLEFNSPRFSIPRVPTVYVPFLEKQYCLPSAPPALLSWLFGFPQNRIYLAGKIPKDCFDSPPQSRGLHWIGFHTQNKIQGKAIKILCTFNSHPSH